MNQNEEAIFGEMNKICEEMLKQGWPEGKYTWPKEGEQND